VPTYSELSRGDPKETNIVGWVERREAEQNESAFPLMADLARTFRKVANGPLPAATPFRNHQQLVATTLHYA